MSFEAGELASPTGATLRFYALSPATRPRAVVHVNHGMAEHAARYERFARFLAGRGYATIAHDHRGHGRTTAPDAPLGRFGGRDGWDKVLADVAAVVAHARRLHPGAPVVTFGHSMGAIVALDYCAARPGETDAAAIWNTSFDVPAALPVLVGLLRLERLLRGSDAPSRLAVALTFEAWNRRFAPNRTDFDWLSRDAAEVDRYVADPLCGFPVSVAAWLDVIASVRRSATAGQLAKLPKSLPVHACAGSRDPSSLDGAAIASLGDRLRKAGLTDVTVTIHEGARHEGLNEINRDEIMLDFASWLDRRFPASSR